MGHVYKATVLCWNDQNPIGEHPWIHKSETYTQLRIILIVCCLGLQISKHDHYNDKTLVYVFKSSTSLF